MVGTSNKTVTVGTSAVEIAADLMPTQRKSIFIINTSTSSQKVSISIAGSPSSGTGVVLSPGGFLAISTNGRSFPNHQQFLAISDGAGATLAIQEVTGNQEDNWQDCIIGGDISVNSGRVTADVSGNVVVSKVPVVGDYTGLSDVSRSSAGNSIPAYTVPASKVAIIVSAMSYASGSAASTYVVKGGTTKYLTHVEAAAVTSHSWNGSLILSAGDTINITNLGTVTYFEISA